MTRKDFATVARAVKKMKSLGADHEYVADLLAVEFAMTYPNFDVDKFKEACGFRE